jgi:hypothetical protein
MKNTKTATPAAAKKSTASKAKTPAKKGGVAAIDTTPVTEKLRGKMGHGIIPEGGNVGYDAHK